MQSQQSVRVDPVLVVSLAGLGGAAAYVAPGPTAVAAVSGYLLLWRHLSAAAVTCAVVALCLGAGRARHTVRDYEARRALAHEEIGQPSRCAGRGTIVVSPVVGRGMTAYVAEFKRLDCEGRTVQGPASVKLYGGPERASRGDVIDVVAQLATVRLFRNADLADPTPGAARRGPVLSGSALSVDIVERGRGLRAAIDRARSHVRRRIQQTFAPAAAPMARALVLGENDLDPRDDEAFRQSGLAHLLAVSGTHLVFAVVALVRALTFLLARIETLAATYDVGRFSAAGGAVLALLYADFAGGSGSAWRAAWMLTAAFAARALDRRPSASRSVAASIAVGTVVDPLCVFDISFLLSVAATAGLIVLGQPLARRVTHLRSSILKYLVTSVIATVASMIPCAPLLALMAPNFTVAGVLANVLAAPLGEIVALPLCLAHTLMDAVPLLERGTALVASGALLVVKHVAHASAAATWLQLPIPSPNGWHFAVIAVGVLAAATRRPTSRVLVLGAAAAALVAIELATIRWGNPRGLLRVTFVDVGQGDSALVDLPDGKLMLIDGGGFVGSPVDPGARVLRPLLRERRRRHIDIVVLSHPHPDHFGGFATGLEEVSVGQFWDSGQGEREGAGPVYSSVLADLRRRGTDILRPADLCGKSREFGGARLRVLGPCPTFRAGANANDNSIVFHLAYGDRSVLFTGDAEAHQENALIAKYGDGLRADLLKVGHHGSKTSTSAQFLDRVRPKLAVMSCGVRNRFGHPHPATLSALHQAGSQVLRLDTSGSVTWETDGKGTQVRAFTRDLEVVRAN